MHGAFCSVVFHYFTQSVRKTRAEKKSPEIGANGLDHPFWDEMSLSSTAAPGVKGRFTSLPGAELGNTSWPFFVTRPRWCPGRLQEGKADSAGFPLNILIHPSPSSTFDSLAHPDIDIFYPRPIPTTARLLAQSCPRIGLPFFAVSVSLLFAPSGRIFLAFLHHSIASPGGGLCVQRLAKCRRPCSETRSRVL